MITTKPGNFEIMRAMATPAGKIWMSPLDNVLGMDKTKHGTKITIGVGIDCINGFMQNQYVGGLYLCDRDEYVATKKRLENEWQKSRGDQQRYTWRPIAEIHEDYGLCVLMNINDPGDMKVGNNLDLDFDPIRYTHFTQIAPLGQEEYERLEQASRTARAAGEPRIED